ncbi:hypothetical protein FHS85_003893 [Rhodoligotrophos appendicifer]|uniref:DUF992 domain-containing protein n=1 Tax=Rhodoligotrophos appendicifer TaxID=987056 RepID=UPI001184DA50|nr:DUF992 domain-containing protein [Rhodoligotrophos appendicifer]
MRAHRFLGLGAVLVPLALLSSPASAAGVKVGVLTCTVASGTGFILGSDKAVSCNFVGNGRKERYRGSFKKFGIDIGTTKKAYVKWVVFAPRTKFGRGALAGTYAGITGEATVGGGVGANALVGGGNRSFTLQPFSASIQTGANVALGVGALELRYVR